MLPVGMETSRRPSARTANGGSHVDKVCSYRRIGRPSERRKTRAALTWNRPVNVPVLNEVTQMGLWRRPGGPAPHGDDDGLQASVTSEAPQPPPPPHGTRAIAETRSTRRGGSFSNNVKMR